MKGKGFKAGPSTLRQFYQTFFALHGGKEFMYCEGEMYTYQEVEEKCLKLITVLQTTYQVQRGTRVVVSMRNFPEWCIGYIAVTYLGAVAVCLPRDWKPKDYEQCLRDAQPKVILCDGDMFKRVFQQKSTLLSNLKVQIVLAKHSIPKMLYDRLPNVDDLDTLLMTAKAEPVTTPDADTTDVGVILYTRGTSGALKGVLLSHNAITSQLRMEWIITKVEDGARIASKEKKIVAQTSLLCLLSLSDVFACQRALLSNFITGRKMFLMVEYGMSDVLKSVQNHRITTIMSWPKMIYSLATSPDLQMYDLSSLKSVVAVGDVLHESIVDQVTKALDVSLAQVYGMTETCGAISLISNTDLMSNKTSCGQLFPVVEACVVDPKDISEVVKDAGKNVVGELLIKSPFVFHSYLGNEELLRRNLVTVEGKGPGWFRSGDLFRIDDRNYLFFVDRVSKAIYLKGAYLRKAEIESLLYELDFVAECWVDAIDDQNKEPQLTCHLRLNSAGQAINPKDIKQKVHEVLSLNLDSFKVPEPERIMILT